MKPDKREDKREMTLSRPSLRTTKGHFCSVLVSNIFCYPLFLSLPFASFSYASKHISFFLSGKYACFFVLLFAKGDCFAFISGFL